LSVEVGWRWSREEPSTAGGDRTDAAHLRERQSILFFHVQGKLYVPHCSRFEE
jgi:hypothetical protein